MAYKIDFPRSTLQRAERAVTKKIYESREPN